MLRTAQVQPLELRIYLTASWDQKGGTPGDAVANADTQYEGRRFASAGDTLATQQPCHGPP